MNKLAIDLLWVRPGKVGGTEVYIRNLLDGFLELNTDYKIVLLTSIDNAQTFKHYTKDKRFEILCTKVRSENIGGRIIWQYLLQNSFLKRNGIRHVFVPVYCRPFFNGGVHYINTIHDIQAYHFPKYHPFHELLYSYVTWFAASKFTRDVITTSEYVRDDICEHFGFKKDRITVIPIPVSVDRDDIEPFDQLAEKYGIEKGEYYYTVSQNIPHKNFKTLVRVIARIKEQGLNLPDKLLVSGISGNGTDEVNQLIEGYGLQDNIIHTGYISNGVRNSLCQNARAFLFPSYYEGFGIPPVEAMMLGQRVITTKATSIPEVTKGVAEYVNDPENVDDWISIMTKKTTVDPDMQNRFKCYNRTVLAKRYMEYLMEKIRD